MFLEIHAFTKREHDSTESRKEFRIQKINFYARKRCNRFVFFFFFLDTTEYSEFTCNADYSLDHRRVCVRAGSEITVFERSLGTRSGGGHESCHGGSADATRILLARALPAGRGANAASSGPHALATASGYRAGDRGDSFPRDPGWFQRDESRPARVCLH